MKVTPRLSSFGKQYNQEAEYENGQLMFNGVLILIATALMISCAKEPYVAKEDEEIFGTWINTSYSYSMSRDKDYSYRMAVHAQKIITKKDGTYEIYGSVNESSLRQDK